MIKSIVLISICSDLNLFPLFCTHRNDLFGFLLKNFSINQASYQEASSKLLLLNQREAYFKSVFIGAITVASQHNIQEWIFAVPLIHLTTKQCKFFETLQEISWDHTDASRYAT